MSEENTYFIDQELVEEMRRLTEQGRLLTDALGGVFPEHPTFEGIADVLDVACGPGEWVFRVASTHPRLHVVGIDKSKVMIRFARAQAAADEIGNVTFHLMDASKPLGFPDASFDLVNARLIHGFLHRERWSAFVSECSRITRPGGMIRVTQEERPLTNSLALEQFYSWTTHAFWTTGQGFSPDHVAILPRLAHFLRGGGWQQVHTYPRIVDFSWGKPSYAAAYKDHVQGLKLVQPFLLRSGIATQEDMDALYGQAVQEMTAPDFCGYWLYITFIGQKPV